MRILLTLFLIIIWTFLILAPLNALAEDKFFAYEPVMMERAGCESTIPLTVYKLSKSKTLGNL